MNWAAILKMADILDSAILMIWLHAFICVSMKDTLYTFKLKFFFIITIKCIDFFLNLAAILKLKAILDFFNLGP